MSKILIVDDDEKFLKLYLDLLSEEGFTVYVATNEVDALRIAKKQIPDLIVLDIMLSSGPSSTYGGAVARGILNNEMTQNIPFIYLSSIVEEEEEEKLQKRAEGLKGATYLSKTRSPKEIVAKIKEILASRGK